MRRETPTLRPGSRTMPRLGLNTSAGTGLTSGLLLASALSLLAACSSSSNTSRVVDAQPGGITLRYPPSDVQAAGVQADEHCAHYGKVSMLIKEKSAGFDAPGDATMYFACVDPAVRQP